MPCLSGIRERKLLHQQARRLLVQICNLMATRLSSENAAALYTDAMLTASIFDIHEVIEAIITRFPLAVHCKDASNKTFLHIAVEYRSHNVFNLMYRTTNHRYHYINATDGYGRSILHMAALLSPARKLDLVPGPAFQMQRELQWFEVIYFIPFYLNELEFVSLCYILNKVVI